MQPEVCQQSEPHLSQRSWSISFGSVGSDEVLLLNHWPDELQVKTKFSLLAKMSWIFLNFIFSCVGAGDVSADDWDDEQSANKPANVLKPDGAAVTAGDFHDNLLWGKSTMNKTSSRHCELGENPQMKLNISRSKTDLWCAFITVLRAHCVHTRQRDVNLSQSITSGTWIVRRTDYWVSTERPCWRWDEATNAER